jgi:hypothetical protein
MVKLGPGAMALRTEGSYTAVLQPHCRFAILLLTDWALLANSSWLLPPMQHGFPTQDQAGE